MPSSPIESFRTHANYIRAFDNLLWQNSFGLYRRGVNMYTSIRDRIIASGVLSRNRRSDVDVDQIRKSMHNAWGTEFLMLTSKQFITEDEPIRLSNNWNCIQAYYVFYHCTQALLVAHGQPRPESHPSTQKAFCNRWPERGLILPPWSLAFSNAGSINIQPGIIIDENIHPWSSCHGTNAWCIAAKALKTTRSDELQEKLLEKRQEKLRAKKRDWRNEEDERIAAGRRPRRPPKFTLPRLTNHEKQEVAERLRPYTIMDYLWRLRIKTNYEDATMFTDGPENETDSKTIRTCLCKLASGTLFLHELMLASILGPDTVRAWLENWVQTNLPVGMRIGITERLQYI